MNKEIRLKKIQEIINRDIANPFGKQEIPWEDDLVSMNVYKIPLNLLVYNKYNGRILSRTKSLEKQNYKIDEFSDSGKKIIEKLLWDSKIDRNRKTQKSIADFGQQKVGIITKDGIIIDGNRRAMLLCDIQNEGVLSGKKYDKKYNYFKAVVLPVTLLENPLEIEKLETSFQMGEDQKLGYNATEKYLKAKEIYLRLTGDPEIILKTLKDSAISKIADWMGESKPEIKKYLSTMVMMDEYLNYLEYDGIYTQLDGREDQFLSLTKWLDTFYGENSKKGFDGYKDEDVDDLQIIAFDYLRIKYEGKEFRNLADGNSDAHFFGNKEIWKSFSENHFEIKDRLPAEAKIDFDSKSLENHLNSRDKLFFDSSKFNGEKSEFAENLKEHIERIGYNKASGAPEKLIKRASQTFEAIKTGHSSFAKPEVQVLVKQLAEKISKTVQKKSPTNGLSIIINSLKNFHFADIEKDEVDAVERQLEEIRKICFDIKKKI